MHEGDSKRDETLIAIVRAVTALGVGLREQQRLLADQHAELRAELATIKGAALVGNGHARRDDESIEFKVGKSRATLDPSQWRAVRPVLLRVLLWAATAAGAGKLFAALGGQ